MRTLKRMISMQEFYTWNWIIREKQKAEAGDKRAFGKTDEELIAEYIDRKKQADG